MNIQQLTSPGGIKAWLVEEHSVPLISLRYAFDGGNSQDPEGKAGVANFITAMMDEGAGDLKSETYQERMEDIAMRMSYDDSQGLALRLVRNADGQSRQGRRAAEAFRAEAALRHRRGRAHPPAAHRQSHLRRQGPREGRDARMVCAGVRRASLRAPVERHRRRSVAKITRDDLLAYHKRVFARDNLKVVAVGDITRGRTRQTHRRSFRRPAREGGSVSRRARPSR